jgi:hypothetical protein
MKTVPLSSPPLLSPVSLPGTAPGSWTRTIKRVKGLRRHGASVGSAVEQELGQWLEDYQRKQQRCPLLPPLSSDEPLLDQVARLLHVPPHPQPQPQQQQADQQPLDDGDDSEEDEELEDLQAANRKLERRLLYNKKQKAAYLKAWREQLAVAQGLKSSLHRQLWPPVRQWPADRKRAYIRQLQELRLSHNQAANNAAEQQLLTFGCVLSGSVPMPSTTLEWERTLGVLDEDDLKQQLRHLPAFALCLDTSDKAQEHHLMLLVSYYSLQERRSCCTCHWCLELC